MDSTKVFYLTIVLDLSQQHTRFLDFIKVATIFTKRTHKKAILHLTADVHFESGPMTARRATHLFLGSGSELYEKKLVTESTTKASL